MNTSIFIIEQQCKKRSVQFQKKYFDAMQRHGDYDTMSSSNVISQKLSQLQIISQQFNQLYQASQQIKNLCRPKFIQTNANETNTIISPIIQSQTSSSDLNDSNTKSKSFSELNQQNSKSSSELSIQILTHQQSFQNYLPQDKQKIKKINTSKQDSSINYNEKIFAENAMNRNQSNFLQYVVQLNSGKGQQQYMNQQRQKIGSEYILFWPELSQKSNYSQKLNDKKSKQFFKAFLKMLLTPINLRYIIQCAKSIQQLYKLKFQIRDQITFKNFVYSIKDGKFKYLLLKKNKSEKQKQDQSVKKIQHHLYQKFCLFILRLIYNGQDYQFQEVILNLQDFLRKNQNYQIKNKNDEFLKEYGPKFILLKSNKTNKLIQIIFRILSYNNQQKITNQFRQFIQTISQLLQQENQFSLSKSLSQNKSQNRSKSIQQQLSHQNQNSSQQISYGNIQYSNYSYLMNDNDLSSTFVQPQRQNSTYVETTITTNMHMKVEESNELDQKKRIIQNLQKNINSQNIQCLEEIIKLLNIAKVKGQKIFQTQQFIQFQVNQNQNKMKSFNRLFKKIQFKEKIRLFLDLISSYEKAIKNQSTIQSKDKDKGMKKIKININFNLKIKLNLKNFKYQICLAENSSQMIQLFPRLILQTLLVIDYQNKNKKISQIMASLFSQDIHHTEKDYLDYLDSKRKYFIFCQKLKTEQNYKISQIFIRFFLGLDQKQLIKIQKQQKQDGKYKQKQFQLLKTQLKNVLYNYPQTKQCENQDQTINHLISKFQFQSLIEKSQINNQNYQDQLDNISLSSIQQMQTILSQYKQKIAHEINISQPIYGKLVNVQSGRVRFQKIHENFDVYQFQKVQKYYVNIQSLTLSGHNFGFQGFKIINNIPFKKLKVYMVWTNNIHTFQDSDFQKLKDLQSFSGTFNPLDVQTVKYFMKHKWPKLKQLRIQFKDDNISWPLMVNQCISHSFQKLNRLRVGQTAKFEKQIMNQNTKAMVKSLQQRGIILL